jgi:hypothetical protein
MISLLFFFNSILTLIFFRFYYRRVRARIDAPVLTQNERATPGQDVGWRAGDYLGQDGEERAAIDNVGVANLQNLFDDVQQPEERVPAPLREFENGHRILFFASEEVKASARTQLHRR